MNSDLYNRLMAEYAKKRKRADAEAEAKKAGVYARLPVLEEIDREITRAGINYTRMTISGDARAPEKLEEIRRLQADRLAVLKAHGYDDADFEPHYECAACSDTGTVGSADGAKKCACIKNRAVQLLNDTYGGRFTAENDFENFDADIYSDAPDQQKYRSKISPRANIQGIKDKCLDFISKMDEPGTRGLYFSGPTGTGKTFLAGCIAREALKNGYSVVYQTAPRMFEAINQLRFSGNDEDFREFIEADLLIIDDLGTENQSGAKYTELLNILNAREGKNAAQPPCKTIISSNMGLKDLYKYYDERIASRIAGGFDAFGFFGEDLRIKLKTRQ